MGIGIRALLFGWNVTDGHEEIISSHHNALTVGMSEDERILAGKAYYNNQEYIINPNSTNHYTLRVESGASDLHLGLYGFVSDQGPMKLTFREAPYIDANSIGTLLPLLNYNRSSVNSSGLLLYGDTYINPASQGLDLGYILQPESAPGNQAAGGASEAAIRHWVLDITKDYSFSVENTTANSATIESRLSLYRSDE